MVISFLASHAGSAARAIIEAIHTQQLDASIGCILCNNRDAAILAWAKVHNIPHALLNASTHTDVDSAMVEILQSYGTDIVVCSGYMKHIGEQTLGAYEGKILNIHPSLLPRHGGEGMYGDRVHAAVLESGDVLTGATVQIVTAHYDAGPILGQRSIAVEKNDTIETLRTRVQAIEAPLYIEVLHRFLEEASHAHH
ncbi:MAG: hypothetical protein KU37_05450 [Sulfuricurvum sp. PC08-66]|nr:MAG: hypothetical protein KU37_05450 [Sulfuricurvum sp. PC08-66]